MKTAEIKITVSLDDKNLPESILLKYPNNTPEYL